MKKLMTTISQAMSRMAIWMKLSKKLTNPISPEIEVEDRLAGVDADLGQLSRLKELGLAQRVAARLQAEAGERIEDDLGEVVVVADDEGEDADVECLLDQPREHVLVGRHRPEEARERDVDGDQHAGEPAHITLNEAEARIDVLGEDAEETVDNAGAAHVYGAFGLGAGAWSISGVAVALAGGR